MRLYYKIRDLISRLFFTPKEPIQEPYTEQSTECDSCDKLQKCIGDNRVFNITVSMDKYKHYFSGFNGCLKHGRNGK